MSERILLKLGGSVITDKSSNGGIDYRRLGHVAGELAAAKGICPLVVHGAGSCGHPEAQRFGIMNGVGRNNLGGIFATHRAVSHLNTAVVNALRASQFEAIGISPLDLAYAENGRLVSMEFRHLAAMLELFMVPVLHGDVVMDGVSGATIVSGDQIVGYLGRKMRFDRIGLATDVPGVLEEGRVVPELTIDSAGRISTGSSRHTDVTGGMAGKLKELCTLAASGRSSEIFSIDRLGDFLAGRPTGGTVVMGRQQ